LFLLVGSGVLGVGTIGSTRRGCFGGEYTGGATGGIGII